MQIYALSLWKLGRHDESLSVSRNLAEKLSSMEEESATAALGFICTLTYSISRKDSAASVIHKLPGQLSYSTQLKFIISALDALQPNKRFKLPQLSMPPRLTSYEVMSEVHSNIALISMAKELGAEMVLHSRERLLQYGEQKIGKEGYFGSLAGTYQVVVTASLNGHLGRL